MQPTKTIIRLAYFLLAYLALVGISQLTGCQKMASSQYAQSSGWFLKKMLPKAYILSSSTNQASGELVTYSLANQEVAVQQAKAARAAGKADAQLEVRDFRLS